MRLDKKSIIEGAVQCTELVLYCITSTEREVFLQKITSFRNLLTEKRKNGPRKASRAVGSHQSLQNFFQDRFSFLLTFWKRRARRRARECLLVN